MSEKKGELDKSSFSALPSSSDTHLPQFKPLQRIEDRLTQAKSPEDIKLWTQVRGDIIKQDEYVKNGKHQRSIEIMQVIRKTSLSGIAIIIGVGLIIKGLTLPGLFILGTGFYELALDYVKNIIPQQRNKEDNEE